MPRQPIPEGHINEQRRQVLRLVRRMHRQAASLAEESVAQAWDSQSIGLAHALMDNLQKFVWWAENVQHAPPDGQNELPW